MSFIRKDKYSSSIAKEEKKNKNYAGYEFSLVVGSKRYDRAELDAFGIFVIDVCVPMKGAGSAVIKFANFDYNNRKFKDVSKMFNLGDIVKIKIGYSNGSNCRTVFKGFVYMLGEEYDYSFPEGSVAFVVTVMDVRKLMMINGNKYEFVSGNSYAAIAKSILSKYRTLLGRNISVSPSLLAVKKPKSMKLSQNTNDYDFIMNEIIGCGKLGADFYVSCGKAYIKKRSEGVSSKPDVAFSINRRDSSDSLDFFKVDRLFIDTKVEAYGYDYEKDKPQKVVNNVKTKIQAHSVKTIADKGICKSEVLCNSYDDVKNVAQNLADDIMYKTWHGSGRGLLNPNIEVGKYIAVDGVDDISSGLHYVTMVRHELRKKASINKGRYEGFYTVGLTYFETEGYKNK